VAPSPRALAADYVELDARDPASWQALQTLLRGHEDRIRAFYLATAPELFEAMERIAEGLRAGEDFTPLRAGAVARLERAGFTGVDYLDLRAQEDLSSLETPSRPARLFAAAWLAGVRLIDNIAVGP